jgi:tetratricopeptide (TPR) repeat protein
MDEETAICTICRQPLGGNGRCQHCDEEAHIWTIQDWRPLLTLSLVIVLGFSFTRLVVSSYNEMQRGLASQYYNEGTRAMEEKHPAQAVTAFESALVYSHDNSQYRLKLTDALVASGASSEAMAQLLDFRMQRPEDAQVNLKLARLEAHGGHVDEALRYYRDAIDGVWPEHSDPVAQKNEARLEAADYLVSLGRTDEAEGVLVAVAAELPAASAEQSRLAELLLRNGDADRALNIYLMQLSQSKNEPAALLGAARASLASGNYGTARRYLEQIKPEAGEAASLRAELDRAEALDPFAHSATGKIRADRTMAAFRIALDRLALCGAPFAQTMTGKAQVQTGGGVDPAQWSGFAKWAGQLAPMMNERSLRGRDDLIESALRFSLRSEIAAQKNCGKPTLDDEALLLLARQRLGAGQ